MTTKTTPKKASKRKPGGGRKPAELTARIVFRLRDEEKAEIEALAAKHGRKLPDHIRFILFPPEAA